MNHINRITKATTMEKKDRKWMWQSELSSQPIEFYRYWYLLFLWECILSIGIYVAIYCLLEFTRSRTKSQLNYMDWSIFVYCKMLYLLRNSGDYRMDSATNHDRQNESSMRVKVHWMNMSIIDERSKQKLQTHSHLCHHLWHSTFTLEHTHTNTHW